MSDPPDNVVALAAAYDKAKPHKPKKSKDGGAPQPPSGPPSGPPSAEDEFGLPPTLPPDAPVKALGTLEGVYYYLDKLVQLRALKPNEHGRLHILTLFGGDGYLKEHWPKFKEVDGKFVRQEKFDHDKMAPVLILSCTEKGTWDPSDKVRGPGCWSEDDGSLVMHCGRWLWLWDARTQRVLRHDTGLRGELVYERREDLPQPDFTEHQSSAGAKLAEILDTWQWKRPEIDRTIVLGWAVCAIYGQALTWRPAIWITGGKGRGKSTLIKLLEWTIGHKALIRPDQASPAYIYQKLGNSCLPVLLDEFEAKQDNAMQQKVIELMRISSSGGKVGRGGSTPDAAKTYTLRSCFLFGSINMQSITPQDQSRLAICELLPFPKGVAQGDMFDAVDEGDSDDVLGDRAGWERAGRELRARLLEQWPRVRKTFRAYRRALLAMGHDKRVAEHFGTLGMGADIALHVEFDRARAEAWAALLPPSALAETLGRDDESEACLKWLLQARLPQVRHGSEPTVAEYLRQARSEMAEQLVSNGVGEAQGELLKMGIRLVAGQETLLMDDKLVPQWWICVASTHQALSAIFEKSHWRGIAGSPGTWAQALRNIDGAAPAKQMRFGRVKQWVTPVPWSAAFPPYDAKGDAEEEAFVDARHADEALRSKTVEM